MSEDVKPKMSLWLRVLLFGSLALNLLVIGLVAGVMIRFGKSGVERPPRTVGTLMYRELSREDRRALWRETARKRDDLGTRRLAEGAAVMAALRQVPFDKTSLESVLDEQAIAREGFHRSVQDKWLARVAAMSDTERAAYADRLEKGIERHSGKFRGWSERHKATD
jgi:uncharacterized membrane protein